MRYLFVVFVVCGLALPRVALADTNSYYYYSLEWLVDASDSIVEATVVPGPYKGNPNQSTATVKTVHRVLKQVGNAGPVAGVVLPTHVAVGREHRVLLFTRPGPEMTSWPVNGPPVKKVPWDPFVYCVYLAADAPPKDKRADPFYSLPRHTSAHERLVFHVPTCVAIDQTGEVLTDPDAVVQLVQARIKAAPERVSADWSKGAGCMPKVDDGDVHSMLVPKAP